MLDLAALPIAFALTLWDAVPIFLSIGLALALVLRVILSPSQFSAFWSRRSVIGLEGAVYTILFYPKLLPLVIAAIAMMLLASSIRPAPQSDVPGHPRQVLKTRAEELLVSIAIAGAVATIIKVFAPDLTSQIIVHVAVAVLAGAVTGFRSGTVALPAVALAIHGGGLAYAGICLLAAVGRTIWALIRQSHSSQSTIGQESGSTNDSQRSTTTDGST